MLRLSSTRGHTARALAVLALFAAAACSDGTGSPTGSMAADAAGPSASHSAGHLQRGKYRDTSLPHATGRSGSATLSASAIVGSDGVTRLRVTSGSIHYPGQARGELAKVQVKVWTEDGERSLPRTSSAPPPAPPWTCAFRASRPARASRCRPTCAASTAGAPTW